MTNDVDPLMTIAWRDFLLFAIGHEPTRAEYERATGRKLLSAPASAIENMIDGATDAPGRSVMHFAAWVTTNIWGSEGVPSAFLKATAPATP